MHVETQYFASMAIQSEIVELTFRADLHSERRKMLRLYMMLKFHFHILHSHYANISYFCAKFCEWKLKVTCYYYYKIRIYLPI